MKKIVNSIAALSPIAAYANAPKPVAPLPNTGAGTETPPNTGTATAPAATTASKRIAPEITPVVDGIAPPTGAKPARGSKSSYDFDALSAPVGDAKFGGSFGVKNKTAKQMSSLVSNQNRRESNFKQSVNADGTPKFEMLDVKDANGVVVGQSQGKPVMEQIKAFVAFDVDPKTDPHGASVRVWRTVVPAK